MSDETQGKEKKKISGIKDVITRLASEDPMIAGIFCLFVIPLAQQMFQAVTEQNLDKIIVIIITISLIIIFAYLPLVATKTVRAYFIKSSLVEKAHQEQQKEYLNHQKELALIRERNKQERLNQLFEAKLQNIQAQTDYIMESTETFETHLMVGIAKEINKGLKEPLSYIQEQKKQEAQNLVDSVIKRLKANNKDYTTLVNMMNAFENSLDDSEANDNSVINKESVVFEDPVLDLDYKLDQSTSTQWTCAKCNYINSKRAIKCRKCNHGKS